MAGEIEELPQWFHYVGSKPTLVVSKGTVIFKSLPVYRDSKEESFPDFLTYGFDIDDSDGKGGCIQISRSRQSHCQLTRMASYGSTEHI